MPSTKPVADAPDAMPARTALVIARRRKGRPVADVVRDVAGRLNEAGVRTQARVVRRKRALRRFTARAVRRGCSMVVCVGGDGTVREVATAVAGSAVPLAVIPTGTGNLLAGGLGIPTDISEAIAAALDGTPRRIDCGIVSVGGRRRLFAVACGVGFDAEVMRRTDSREKRRLGVLAYAVNAVREAGSIRDQEHEVTIDGVTSRVPASEVIVANLGRIPPGITVDGVQPDDGVLDVFIIRAPGPLSALAAGWEVIRGAGEAGGRLHHVHRARARTVKIDARPRRTVELDGSAVGRTPVSIRVKPAALMVMVPQT